VGKILILISCSDDKTTSRETHFKSQQLPETLSNHIRIKLFQKRREIKDLIQSGKVYDFKIKDENRIERESNRLLIEGPDFNGKELKPVYLPARTRYRGRFFNRLTNQDWKIATEKGYVILIISALYGVLLQEDSIQNYNCHFTDSLINIEKKDILSEITLKNIWKEVLTEALIDFIKINNIEMIIDLLSEESYQNSIRWQNLSKTRILHRLFQNKSGPAIIPNLTKFFKNEIIPRAPSKLIKSLDTGYRIERKYFQEDVLIFENFIGEIKTGYSREYLKYDKEILSHFPSYWKNFSKIEKDGLRLAEELNEKFETSNLIRQRTTASTQEYWGILEFSRKCFLQSLLKSFKNQYKQVQDELIILHRQKNIKFYISELSNIIYNKNNTEFSAYKTELLLKRASQFGYISQYKFLQFIYEKLGGKLLRLFVNYYPILRRLRNQYKEINVQKSLEEIKKDINDFRDIILNEEISPLVLFQIFEEKLSVEN